MERKKNVIMDCAEFVSFLEEKGPYALRGKNLTQKARCAREHMISCSECMSLTAEALIRINGIKD